MHRESSIEQPAVELLAQHGWVVLKVGHTGYPDRLALKSDGFRDEFIWLEFKTASGSLTPAQKRRIPKLEKQYHTVLVIDSLNHLRESLDRGYYPFTRGG